MCVQNGVVFYAILFLTYLQRFIVLFGNPSPLKMGGLALKTNDLKSRV